MLGNFLNSIQERKKSVNGLVGADIPRASGFVWISYYSSFSKWTTTSRTYRARHARNFGRGPVCGFQSRRSREQCGRAGARDVGSSNERTSVLPPFALDLSTKERIVRLVPNSLRVFAPRRTRILLRRVEWNDRFEPFHLPTWKKVA